MPITHDMAPKLFPFNDVADDVESLPWAVCDAADNDDLPWAVPDDPPSPIVFASDAGCVVQLMSCVSFQPPFRTSFVDMTDVSNDRPPVPARPAPAERRLDDDVLPLLLSPVPLFRSSSE